MLLVVNIFLGGGFFFGKQSFRWIAGFLSFPPFQPLFVPGVFLIKGLQGSKGKAGKEKK